MCGQGAQKDFEILTLSIHTNLCVYVMFVYHNNNFDKHNILYNTLTNYPSYTVK